MSGAILPDHELRRLIDKNRISSPGEIDLSQIQPASLDLTLGKRAWRLRAGFLPMDRKVEQCLGNDNVMHELSLNNNGAVLETGCVYLVELNERLELPEKLSAACNPKSSTGRIDVFVRVIGDNCAVFDHLPAGYDGPLYAEVSPRTFSILLCEGDRLTQLRLRDQGNKSALKKELICHVGLHANADNALFGYRARRHSGVIACGKKAQLDPCEFWEPITVTGGRLILDPGEIYILVSAEKIVIDAMEAAEMAPIAPELGEFRAHYAGFFDPGFGLHKPAHAVLEVRAHDVPFILEDGQPVAKLVYNPLTSGPEKLYGDQGNHYSGQGLKLSKHFMPWPV